MMSNPSDVFVEALRQDVPGEADRERMRAVLLAAGVAVGASATATGVAAQMTSAAQQAGMFGKLALLPAAVKVGICVAALATVTGVGMGLQPVAPAPVALPEVAHAAAVVTAKPPAPVPTVTAQLEESVPVPEAQARSTEIAQTGKHRSKSATPVTPKTLPDAHEPPLMAADTAVPSGLADEAALLEQSLRALAQHQTANAQRFLDLHRQRYPHGALSTERQRAEQQLRAMNSATEPNPTEPGASHE